MCVGGFESSREREMVRKTSWIDFQFNHNLLISLLCIGECIEFQIVLRIVPISLKVYTIKTS